MCVIRRHFLACEDIVNGPELSEPAARRREQAVPAALLWRLEQEDQRLKKHDGRWIDIQRLHLLESFILTKSTKPSIPVNLVGPQVSLPLCWVLASRGSIHFYA